MIDEEACKSSREGFVNVKEILGVVLNFYEYHSCSKCRNKIEDEKETVLQCNCGNAMKKKSKKIVTSDLVIKITFCVKENEEAPFIYVYGLFKTITSRV